MEMEMEMRAGEDIEIGEDITPPLTPLSLALHDSLLSSHCSSCFSPLPPSPFPPLFTPTFPKYPHHVLSSSSSYCSPLCSASDSPLHVSSAEPHLLHLLQSRPSTYPHGDSSDLRAALRLLHSLTATCPCPRIAGLLTNHSKLLHHDNQHQIHEGARAMFLARTMRDETRNVSFDTTTDSPHDALLEEAALCLVLTNAVEVQDKTGRTLGVSVYGPSFCWINHSCSPNACYRFSVSPPPPLPCPTETVPLRIVPSTQGTQIESGVCSNNLLAKECRGYGPRVIVRSIKRIKKGEQVTVTYTDLLQPKALRQSELWSKYRFLCSCTRCSTSLLTYVDQALEVGNHDNLLLPTLNFQKLLSLVHTEISAANFSSSLSSDINFDRDKATQRLTDYIDDAIDDYLSTGDPESSCEKLEHVLTQGLSDKQSECEEETSQLIYWLQPLHHLSLNAHTTLASAYKNRATDLLALYCETDDHLLKALELSRTSAAYSLLLAGATHHLFLSESSLIVSVANLWTSAGESLLILARSSFWSEFVQRDSLVSNPCSARYRCPKCSLIDKFITYLFHGQVQHADFEYVSKEFIDCVTIFTQNVWNFLGLGCEYLRAVKNPIDFSWLGTTKYSGVGEALVWFSGTKAGSNCGTERNTSGGEAEGYTNQVRICIYNLGVHCLLYGGYLASICYGISHLTNIRNVLDLGESVESLS